MWIVRLIPTARIFLPTPVIVLSCLFFITQCSSVPIQPSNLETLDLQGHRGARGLRPENTWPAFQAAIEYRMTTLELDTVLTQDGKVVVHHDSETNPDICQNDDGTSIQRMSLYGLTLADLKKLDCGSKKNPKFPEQVPVPGTRLISIDEFFQLVAKEESKRKGLPPLQFNIETKFPDDESSRVPEDRMKAHVKALVASIEKAKVVDRSVIQSFYLPALSYSKSLNPKIRTSALFAPTYPQGIWMILGGGSGYRAKILEETSRVKAEIISPYFLYVNAEFMAEARKRSLQVIPWTVNEKKEMKRLISLGVDGIITDYPDRLIEVVQELKAIPSR